ncbi:MAG: hypothetical protein FWC24_04860 [Treponema sp.]|nr:hypothetical protein [Treponema sp.]
MNPKLRDIPLLHITLFAGVMLLLLIGGVLAGTYLSGRGVVGEVRVSAFHRLLEEYDFKYRQLSQEGAAVRRQGFERLDNDLNRLEKQAEAVESWLSILKRRRQLAGIDPHYEQSYRQSSRRAALAFPYSEPIAAVAAAALVYNAGITREDEAYLRKILPLLAGSRVVPLRLSLHVLLGDFNNLEQALARVPRNFASPGLFAASVLDKEVIYPDLVILKILAGDIPSASIDIQTALNAFPSGGLIRLAAEYFYDFGSLLRSAELFSALSDEAALLRQADALWLAGYPDSARTIWAMFPAHSKALYNLAMTALTLEEEVDLLQKLASGTDEDISRRFGLIRFSRLFEAPRAVAILDAGRGAASPADTLIDLEILRRRTEIAEMTRIIAETWLLLERYPGEEDLYQWGAWYFDLQRSYAETSRLLKTAERYSFSGYWMGLHEAFQQIRRDNLDAAEDILVDISAINSHWTAAANLGRILEARRAPARALDKYEQALAAVVGTDDITASRIQVRVAHCLKTLGRFNESRRALEYALDLNPDNLTARLELNRLE